jgi:hypothetical protein
MLNIMPIDITPDDAENEQIGNNAKESEEKA